MKKKTKKGLDRHYVSEMDQFLQAFDKTNPKAAFSASRLTEERQYEKIAQARDG